MGKVSLPVVDVNRKIDAAADVVWDLITDTRRWPQWGPSVRAVRCAECYIHEGLRGQVQTIAGLWLPFTVTDFEHNSYWAWRVAGILATGHRVEPLSTEQCQLSFTVPLLAAPYAVVCRLAAVRIEQICAQ